MNKEQQDLAWACLPKETRERLRVVYQAILLNKQWYYSAYLHGRLRTMSEIYGEHNLTSDAEPETMRNNAKESEDLSLLDKQTTETKDAYEQYQEAKAEEYHNQLKDNMEEKELNLCELLKGCEGEEIFDIEKGIVKIFEVKTRSIRTKSDEGIIHFIGKYIEQFQSGGARFYPSRALYEKYPLDAYSAWMEWKREKEREQNKIGFLTSPVGKRWELKMVAKFNSEEESRQAAEVVKEALQKFHESHKEK